MANSAEINEIVSDFSRVYILTILHEGPVHGYQIISKFKKVIGKDVSPSLVYPFLKQLEQKGLVTHTLKPVGAKRGRFSNLLQMAKSSASNCLSGFQSLLASRWSPAWRFALIVGVKSTKEVTRNASKEKN